MKPLNRQRRLRWVVKIRPQRRGENLYDVRARRRSI